MWDRLRNEAGFARRARTATTTMPRAERGVSYRMKYTARRGNRNQAPKRVIKKEYLVRPAGCRDFDGNVALRAGILGASPDCAPSGSWECSGTLGVRQGTRPVRERKDDIALSSACLRLPMGPPTNSSAWRWTLRLKALCCSRA